MKKIYFLLFAFSFFTTANAQIVNIPNANFKAKLLAANTNNSIAKNLSGAFLKIDANNDGQIQESEALNVGYLDVSNSLYVIASLVGIEKFTNLKNLDCNNASLTTLNLSGLVYLETLNCYQNKLNTLELTGLINLKTLNCYNNKLTSLITTDLTNLETLNCYGNILNVLELNGLINLKTLNCYSNQLKNLYVSGITNLETLNCYTNSLTSLTVTNLPNLKTLNCNSNPLTEINVTGLTNLENLDCVWNLLVHLNIAGLSRLKTLNCSNNQLVNLNIAGLSGLKTLNCSGNQLVNLNLSGLTSLQQFGCNSNKLTVLNLTELTNLKSLTCSNNQLTDLIFDSLPNIEFLEFSSNKLTSLNIKNSSMLQSLSCSRNELTNLTLDNLPNLKELNCSYNRLTNLNLNSLINLSWLWCQNNQLASINLKGLINLKTFLVYSNNLKNLEVNDLLNLETFECANNQLVNLDINGLTKLSLINVINNQLTTIKLSGLTKLFSFYCNLNQLTELNLNGLTNLKNVSCMYNKLISMFLKNGKRDIDINFENNPDLKYICADEQDFASINSRLIYYGYKNCVMNSYCSFVPEGTYYTIEGNHKIDSNLNGCDVLDMFFPNSKLTLSNGSTTTGIFISDASGNYSIPVQEGIHTITPKLENPTCFTVSPTTVNITFPTQTSPFTQNFCITPNGVRPDLEVTLLPLQPARPGFDAKYKLVYKNKGNTTQSGSVNLAFNDAVLDLVVANPVASSQTTNTLSWNFTNLQPFETREITFTMNVNSPMEIPAVNIDDILAYTVAITSSVTDETPTDNTFTFNQTVLGSYDPNDKTCLEGSVITPNLIGQYVHYTIRFENTGTFAAENVVVKDMIDLAKFDISTLVPTSASHSYITRISEGNKVEFIFENINLPFDDANNDGYIAFKIKTKPTLVVNDSFSNEASIFFDYNFPIVTNKATSTFKTLGTQDFDFDRYFTVYPNPATTVLTIKTKESINIGTINVYNTLGQLVLVIPNAEKVSTMDVSNLKSGNYFIQIKTDKGSSSSKFVKE